MIMPPKKTKTPAWITSKGRKTLFREITTGKIFENMKYEQVFHMHPEFAVGDTQEEALRLFENRLANARKIIGAKKQHAATELAMLQQDRLAHPFPSTNHRGEPQWEGSAAQKVLKKDVENKKHETMSRTAFYNLRPEYDAFPKTVIDGKIQQEERLLKFMKQMRNKKGYDDDDNNF